MRILAAAIATLLLIAAPASARPGKDSWYLLSVSSNFNEAILVDVTSIKTQEGSTRTASIEAVEAVPTQPGNVAAVSARVIVDCAAKTLKFMEATSYDLEGQMLSTSPPGQSAVPVAGSRGEGELNFICSDPSSWQKGRLIDEGAVGGSIREYTRFMLQGMALDAVDGAAGLKK